MTDVGQDSRESRTDQAGPRYGPRHETEAERLDRNFGDLLQELRVSQTGVQILFAFLLTLAFTQRFLDISQFQRNLYVVVLLLATTAAALIIAPVALHRMVFRQQAKDLVVSMGSALALAGLGALLLAMTGSVWLIMEVVLDNRIAAVIGAVTGLVIFLLWILLPLIARMRARGEHNHRERSGRPGQ